MLLKRSNPPIFSGEASRIDEHVHSGGRIGLGAKGGGIIGYPGAKGFCRGASDLCKRGSHVGGVAEGGGPRV